MPREIKVELLKKAFLAVRDYFQQARAGDVFVDGALIEFLRVRFADPELPIWERFWLERKRDLDRKRYGQFKSRNADLEFCLNVWNRNHFNLFRNAQWPGAEQTCYVDCVKPISYQNQLGQVHVKELGDPHKSILRDFIPPPGADAVYIQNARAPRGALGLPDRGRNGPRHLYTRAVCRYGALHRRHGPGPHGYRGGCAACANGKGDVPARRLLPQRAGDLPRRRPRVIFAPNYASMHLENLEGLARALRELGRD